MGKILDGKGLSDKILNKLADSILENNYSPTLAVILVGNNPASEVYVSVKEKACNKIGIKSVVYKFDENTEESVILNQIRELNENKDIDGILVQLPLPMHIDKFKVIETISPQKDVDGFTIYNFGRVALGLKPHCYPCTPKGILTLLDEYKIQIEGKNVVVVGRSDIVGKPLANIFLKRNATVTICHSKTKNLAEITNRADILVAAIGCPKFITADMVRDGAILIDVGISRVDGKLSGDIDFDGVFDKAAYITPVPKGIGPMTIASLMENTLELYKSHNH